MIEDFQIQITCSETIAKDIAAEVRVNSEAADVKIINRKNLDGNAASWIVMATLAFNALPHILSFISTKTTRKIKVTVNGNTIEMDNPTEEDMKFIKEKFLGDNPI